MRANLRLIVMAATIALAMPWAGSGQLGKTKDGIKNGSDFKVGRTAIQSRRSPSGAGASMTYEGTCKGSIDGEPISEKPCTIQITPAERGGCGSNTLRTLYSVNGPQGGLNPIVGAITIEGTKFTAVTCPAYAEILSRTGGGTVDSNSLEGTITAEVKEKHASVQLRGKKITASFQAKATSPQEPAH